MVVIVIVIIIIITTTTIIIIIIIIILQTVGRAYINTGDTKRLLGDEREQSGL